MRNLIIFFAALSAACLLCSCNDLFLSPQEDKGEILLSFSDDFPSATKASSSIPDTNSFILDISSSSGETVYRGTYGAAPEKIIASSGTYNISVRSKDFSSPVFDCPVYGDDRVVVVPSGGSVSVVLSCTQVNAGVKLSVDAAFLTDYPNGSFHLKSSGGSLMYSYSEKRYAYFSPGNVSLVMSESGKDKTLLTKRLEAAQMLQIKVNCAASSSGSDSGSGTASKSGFSIKLDTTRVYLSETYTLGGGQSSSGSDTGNAMSVTQARTAGTQTDVWVYGYIVGGDLSSSQCSFSEPFSSRTNIVLASKSSCKDKQLCLSVQLNKGDIRDALNLVDHPDLLGRQVFIKGDLVDSYYGIPGLQSLTEYKLK